MSKPKTDFAAFNRWWDGEDKNEKFDKALGKLIDEIREDYNSTEVNDADKLTDYLFED